MRKTAGAASIAAVFVLGVLAAHHLSKGFYYLAVENPATAAADFYNRRLENAYFLERVPPQSQNFFHLSKSDSSLRRYSIGADPSERRGVVVYSGLPPWAYPLQLGIFLPAPDRIARWYLASLNVVALAIIACLAYSKARRQGAAPLDRTAALLSVLAIGATNATLMAGQNSLIVNAGLGVALMALLRPPQASWDVAGGAGLAIAMLKPSSALLFLLVPLMRRRFALLGVCSAIVGIAWAGSAWWLRMSPIFQLQQFERATQIVVTQGANVWLMTLARLLTAEQARNVFLLAGILAGTIGAYTLRDQPTRAFAFLAIAARHRAYDDVLLAFVLIALVPRHAGIWLLVGLSLWLPYSVYMSDVARLMQSLCWTAAAVLLIRDRPRGNTVGTYSEVRGSTAASIASDNSVPIARKIEPAAAQPATR